MVRAFHSFRSLFVYVYVCDQCLKKKNVIQQKQQQQQQVAG